MSSPCASATSAEATSAGPSTCGSSIFLARASTFAATVALSSIAPRRMRTNAAYPCAIAPGCAAPCVSSKLRTLVGDLQELVPATEVVEHPA